MNLSYFLAKKYYFSKSRKSFVNKISALAIIIIALMVIAEVVILSVFNGFTDQLKSIHQAFDCDLELSPKEGKVLKLDDAQINAIRTIDGVLVLSRIFEDDAILDYQGRQDVVRLKGVDSNFFTQNSIIEHLEIGDFDIFDPEISAALIGVGIEYKFDINMKNPGFLKLMYPNRMQRHLKKSSNSYKDAMVLPKGVFRIEMEYDERYMFLPLAKVQSLTGYDNQFTAIELKIDHSKKSEIEKTLVDLVGENTLIKDRDQRHESIYKAIQVEKMMTYLIFLLILFVASLNLYAAVSMLVLSKQKDISTLHTLGAPNQEIRKIFLKESILIILTGITAGSLIAFGLVYLQDKIGVVAVPEPNVILSHIPVRMSFVDFIISVGLTFSISLLMVIRPIISSAKNITHGQKN